MHKKYLDELLPQSKCSANISCYFSAFQSRNDYKHISVCVYTNICMCICLHIHIKHLNIHVTHTHIHAYTPTCNLWTYEHRVICINVWYYLLIPLMLLISLFSYQKRGEPISHSLQQSNDWSENKKGDGTLHKKIY